MLTGFEALGAASAVLQVISFASSVTSQCYKIYNGQVTTQEDLEAYAAQMTDAVGRVQNRYPLIPQGSSDEKKLAEIAQRCIEAAKALEAETQQVTKLCKKRSISKAIYGTFLATRHKGKIEQLEKSLQAYKEVMEAHLLLKLCTKSDAIEQQQSTVFPSLERDVQNLISQIAGGYQKTEDLIRVEQHTTRGLITTEAIATRREVHDEVRGLGTSLFSSSQHERLLKSLKASEMNQRYHDVMDSAEASFERVFLSYERVTSNDQSGPDTTEHEMSKDIISESSSVRTGPDMSEDDLLEIDQAWTGFTSWLESNDQEIFWVRGKPGSGKSTLMKFVIENESTSRLLVSWRPDARIVSHFFWKIGSPPQNSIKGLLCSLLYSALDGNSAMIDRVLEHFKASSSKDSYHDWSVRDLEEVLFLTLESQIQPICFFIDGLDEVSDKERILDVKRLITKLNAFNNIKVCVSSRPETQLLNMFDAMGVRNLRLEDLTRPEMAAHVRKEFQAVQADKQVSPSFREELADMLLEKAEGVFLWLFLAMKSVIGGIQNRDDQMTLRQRLYELPRELEDLYAEMWSRLNANNSVYRKTAERYFNYVIPYRLVMQASFYSRSGDALHLSRLTLAEIALAERPDIHHILTTKLDGTNVSNLKSLCEKASDNIEARCAGLLQLTSQVGPNSIWGKTQDLTLFMQVVSFVHRTAHDFLVDTEAGQHILNHKNDPSLLADTDVRLLKSRLCLTIILNNRFGIQSGVYQVIDLIAMLVHQHSDLQTAEILLSIAQDLFNKNILISPKLMGLPRPHFVALLANYTSLFNDFVVSSLKSIDSSSVATSVLRDISKDLISNGTSPQFVRDLIAFGADPHAPGVLQTGVYMYAGLSRGFAQQVTAFELVLRGALNLFLFRDELDLQACVQCIEMMAPTCPNWCRKMLIAKELETRDRDSAEKQRYYYHHDRGLWGWENARGRDYLPWVACEVDFQFLLLQFIAASSSQQRPPCMSRLLEISKSFKNPLICIRHVHIFEVNTEDEYFYRILTQEPVRSILNDIFTFRLGHEIHLDDILPIITSLETKEQLDTQTEYDALAQEGLLCHLSDFGNSS